MNWFDYGIIAVYFVVTIGLGLHYARRWKASEDFFLAGRNLMWPTIGLSLFATNISTEHFVGLAAGGNREGMVQGGYEWIASYCLLMLAIVLIFSLAGRLRQNQSGRIGVLAMYWHFVDAVWVVVFTTVYIVGR